MRRRGFWRAGRQLVQWRATRRWWSFQLHTGCRCCGTPGPGSDRRQKRNLKRGLRQVLSARWPSDLFLWTGCERFPLLPAVRPPRPKSHCRGVKCAAFSSQKQIHMCSKLAALRSPPNDAKRQSSIRNGQQTPLERALGMLRPIGNRKVERRQNALLSLCPNRRRLANETQGN